MRSGEIWNNHIRKKSRTLVEDDSKSYVDWRFEFKQDLREWCLASNWHWPLKTLDASVFRVRLSLDCAPLFLLLVEIRTGQLAFTSDTSCGMSRLIGRSWLS